MQNETTKYKPIGLRVLSILCMVGGLYTVSEVSAFTDIPGFIARGGTVPPLLLECLFGVVLLGSGIGIWLNQKWAWWTGTSYALFILFANVVCIVISLFQSMPAEHITLFYIEYGVRTVVAAIICSYLFNRHVLIFFEIETMPKRKAVAILVPAAALATALSFLVR